MEQNLRTKELPIIPFHASPLMYGKDAFRNMDMETRKKLFANFEAFCRRAPFTCTTFLYRRNEVPDPSNFITRFKRGLVIFLTDNLEYFQQFELVKIYYDNGQQMVTEALHGALDFILYKESVLYRAASSKEYRLSQVADCVCAIELVNLKFLNNELTETDTKMFGTNYSAFKKNHLRHIRRKLL